MYRSLAEVYDFLVPESLLSPEGSAAAFEPLLDPGMRVLDCACGTGTLAAGLALVMMEVLTDFATVQYFGVQTVSVGVYLVWHGLFNFHAATQLSALVLLFAVAVLAGERLMRGRARYHQKGGRGRGLEPYRLTGWRGWSAPCRKFAATSRCTSPATPRPANSRSRR